jgi:hypothetical protein
MMRHIKTYPYTVGFLFSILMAVLLQYWGIFHALIAHIGNYAYLASFVSGILFASTFTSVPATLFFFDLGSAYNPYSIALLGGCGAMIGDLLMYSIIKKSIAEELRALITGILAPHRRETLEKIMEHRVFLFTVPFLASALIASPLPDEIGLALFSTINFRPRYLSIIALILNTVGIFAIVMLGFYL